MSWVRLDDNFPTHPKTVAIGRLAVVVYVFGLCYCRRHLTGGFIPDQALKVLGATKADVDRLTAIYPPAESPYWVRTKGGYQVHGYREQYDDADHKVAVDERRRRRQDAGRKGGRLSGVTKQNTKQNTTFASTFASTTDEAKRDVCFDQPESPVHERYEANGKPIGVRVQGTGGSVRTSEESSRETTLPIDVEWAQFVAAYPSEGRTSSRLAQGLFLSARSAGVTLASMVAALDNHAASARWLDGKIPNLTKWLEERRWEQRLPAPKKPVGGRTGAAPPGKYDGIELPDED